jgi:hypothetical protein
LNSSQTEVVEVREQQIGYLHERIDFREGLNKLTYTYFEGDKQVRRDSLLKQKISEVNTISSKSFKCENSAFTGHTALTFAQLWAPQEVYGSDENAMQTALGMFEGRTLPFPPVSLT